ncbi:NAD(P)/FAD-dependent oxidoreductase [Halodesulfovibrio sp. MK-HDV]|uniref:phytoene desaturase family protein n=1 Tax=Halodesulfovibrio sp. MK-HDV TaxID=2599925 RepID=UPI00136AB4D4|nr:NAD(P)/FAD-dependent oxidoreductase [Halodesulfovibrio sp. MK-HDV]KAF1074907.1 Dehydrosqualene desaturase [Halodesulfovibrio sp. MK-HDV]
MQCVVIGSGCAGLTSALIMAKNGYNVTVVEKSVRTAPLLQGFERKGFYFDTGVHCLSGLDAGGPLRSLLEYLNVYEKLTYLPFSKDNSFAVHFPDGLVWQMPQGYDALQTSLVALFPQEEKGIKAFLQEVRALSHTYQYNADFQAIATHPLASKSFKDVVEQFISEPQVKMCLGILSNLFCGLLESEAPFVFFASSIGTYFRSSGTFKGGGRALFEAMQAELTNLDGRIVYNNGVADVIVDDNRQATGVVLDDGSYLSSDMLIATCHPACLSDILPEASLRRVRKTYYQELESTTSLLGVYGYTTKPIEELVQSNVIIASDTASADDVLSAELPIAKRQMLITSSETTKHGTSISLFTPAAYTEWARFEGKKPHQRINGYVEKKHAVAAEIVLAATRALPELKDYFSIVSVTTPLTIKDYCNAPYGAGYGVKHSVNQLPPTAAFPIKNMLLSGQAIVGPGILGAMTAGFVTCGDILGHTHLQSEIKNAVK